MKMLRVRSGAVKSARYRLILLMISGAVLLQVPSWLGRMTLTGLSALANSARAKLVRGQAAGFRWARITICAYRTLQSQMGWTRR